MIRFTNLKEDDDEEEEEGDNYDIENENTVVIGKYACMDTYAFICIFLNLICIYICIHACI